MNPPFSIFKPPIYEYLRYLRVFTSIYVYLRVFERVTVQMTTLYEYLRVFDQKIFFDQKNISPKNLD